MATIEMATLLFLLNLCIHICKGTFVLENFCKLTSDFNDRYVCDLYQTEIQIETVSKESIQMKYSRYFIDQINDLSPEETGLLGFDIIDINSNFFIDVLNVLTLKHLIVLIQDIRVLKLKQIKELMIKSEFKVSIRPFGTFFKVENMDESVGIFVCGGSKWIVENLYQTNSQVTLIVNDFYWMTNHSYMQIDSNIFQYQVKNHGGITLDEVYYKPNGDFVLKSWGLWTPNNGFITVESDKMDRRSDMTGIMLKATTMQNPPFIWVSNKDKEVEISGFLADVWNIFKTNLNFTDEIIESIDGQYGGLTENGSWNGMIGMLERNEVDIAISDATLSENRAVVASYSTPIQSNNVMIFIKTPGVDNNDWFLFVKLFRPELWLALVGILLPITFFYTFLVSKNDGMQGIVIFSGIVTGQGSYLESHAKVPRIILITLLFSGLILISSYSANLTSNLFIKTIKLPFHDLKSLYHQSDYKVGTIPGTLWYNLFSLANDGSDEKQLFLERFIEVANVENAIELMSSNSKFAFVWDEESVYRKIPNSCHFQSILYKTKQTTFYMRKGFPHKNIFDRQIRLLKESGQMNKLWNKWKPWKESNCFPIKSEAVQFGKIIGPISLFSCLLLISSIILFIETMLHKILHH